MMRLKDQSIILKRFLMLKKIDESHQNISLSERQKYQLMIRYFHRIFVLSINSIMFLLFTVR